MKRRPPRRVRKADFLRAEQLLARFDVLTPAQRRWLNAHTNRVLARFYWGRDITKSTNPNWRGMNLGPIPEELRPVLPSLQRVVAYCADIEAP